MTTVVGYCLAGIGIVLLAVGYFRKSRNLMLAGTVTLLVGTGWKEILEGAVAGWKATR